MSSFFGAVLFVGGVMALCKVFGLFPRAWQVVRTSRSALEVMNNATLADDRKESLLQEYSLVLFRACLALMIRSVGSIAVPIGLLMALEFAGVLSLTAVLAFTLSWPFLLGSVVAAIAAFCLLEQ